MPEYFSKIQNITHRTSLVCVVYHVAPERDAGAGRTGPRSAQAHFDISHQKATR